MPHATADLLRYRARIHEPDGAMSQQLAVFVRPKQIEEHSMTRLIVAAAAAAALIGTTSEDAGTRHARKQQVRAWQSVAVAARPPGPAYRAAYLPLARGPSWAGPNECFTDDGYGRYAPSSGSCGSNR